MVDEVPFPQLRFYLNALKSNAFVPTRSTYLLLMSFFFSVLFHLQQPLLSTSLSLMLLTLDQASWTLSFYSSNLLYEAYQILFFLHFLHAQSQIRACPNFTTRTFWTILLLYHIFKAFSLLVPFVFLALHFLQKVFILTSQLFAPQVYANPKQQSSPAFI